MSTAWLLAPLAAGSLAVSADWAVQHDPMRAASAGPHSARPAVTSGLQRRAQVAAHRLQVSQAALVRLETAEQQRSDQLDLLRAEIRAIQKARRLGRRVPLPMRDSTTGQQPPAHVPARVAIPPAPSVNATTGAS